MFVVVLLFCFSLTATAMSRPPQPLRLSHWALISVFDHSNFTNQEQTRLTQCRLWTMTATCAWPGERVCFPIDSIANSRAEAMEDVRDRLGVDHLDLLELSNVRGAALDCMRRETETTWTRVFPTNRHVLPAILPPPQMNILIDRAIRDMPPYGLRRAFRTHVKGNFPTHWRGVKEEEFFIDSSAYLASVRTVRSPPGCNFVVFK